MALQWAMRRALVWLLLSLLPWRLWAADAMALQACHGPMPWMGVSVTQLDESVLPHAAHAPSDGVAAHDPAQRTHAGCSLCDICHNAPLMGSATVALRSHAPQRWGLSQSHLPPSPTVAPPHKPPIA